MGLFKALENAMSGVNDIIDPDHTDRYCDNCGSYLNVQPGFVLRDGDWICWDCGYCNEIRVNDGNRG